MKKILNIEINWYKSIAKEIKLNITNSKLNYFLGKNGVGKSNILKSIDHIRSPQSANNTNTMFKGYDADLMAKNTEITLWTTNDSKIQMINESGFKSIRSYIIDDLINENYFTNISFNFSPEFDFVTHPLFKKKILDDLEIDLDIIYPIIGRNSNHQENYENISNELGITIADKFKEYELIYEIVSKEFDERTKTSINYISDCEQFIDHKYSYNLRSSTKIVNWDNEEIDLRLKKILKFLYSICFKYSENDEKPFDLKASLRNYLDTVSSEIQTNSETIEQQITFFRNEIIEKCNSYLQSFFDEYFKNVFDFKLMIDLINDNLYFKLVPIKTNKYDNEDINHSSAGSRTLINFIIYIESILYKNVYPNIIFLLDEPEKNLYPSLQNKFVEYLEKKIDEKDIFVLISTHHSAMISKNDSTVNIIDRDFEGSTINDVSYGECYEDGCESLSNSKAREFITKIIEGNESFVKIIQDEIAK